MRAVFGFRYNGSNCQFLTITFQNKEFIVTTTRYNPNEKWKKCHKSYWFSRLLMNIPWYKRRWERKLRKAMEDQGFRFAGTYQGKPMYYTEHMD